MSIENNVTNENVKSTMLNEIIRPCLDDNNCCTDFDNNTISDCTIDDKGNITGYTIDHTKAFYNYDKNTWYFGRDIGRYNNLISLKDRTVEERKEISDKAREKARENRENKKNFNELAKAMLEQTLSNKQIQSILGDNTSMLLDDSVASVILGSMIQGALNGSFKCAEFVRDTAGYKPKNEVELSADIITESDKALIDKALKNA